MVGRRTWKMPITSACLETENDMKSINIIVIPAVGEATARQVSSYDEMTAIVGGYLEVVCGRDFSMYLNEEGKMTRLLPNHRATQFCAVEGVGLDPHDVIAGDVFLCGLPDRQGEDTDVPERLRELL